MVTSSRRQLLKTAIGAASIAIIGRQLILPSTVHAANRTFPGVRQGIYQHASCSNKHHYVEFEPNTYADTWSMQTVIPALTAWLSPMPFWGDTSRRAYKVLRAYYHWSDNVIDPPPNVWQLVGTNASPVIPGDLNKDGKVDILDYNIYLANGGKMQCGNVADINGDCVVNTKDYSILQSNLGKTFEVQRWDNGTTC